VDKSTNINSQFWGTGWSFPITFEAGNSQLEITYEQTNINASMQLILNTRKGERTLSPNFGGGLQEYMFQKMDSTLKGQMTQTIQKQLLKYEPRITVKGVTVEFTDLQSGTVEITIEYLINTTNTRHNYVFPYNLKEGTNL